MAEELKSTDILKASEYLSKAGPLYRAAADLYPSDDEHSVRESIIHIKDLVVS